MINWENKQDILKELDKEYCVRFALKAAKLVQHLSDDSRVSKAIEAAENWLANPCEENTYAAADAAVDAYAATNAAYAANDNACVAYAAGDAAAGVADDDDTAYVDYAADAAADADPNVKPILVSYLRELYLNSLPPDEKDNWLVQTMVGVSND